MKTLKYILFALFLVSSFSACTLERENSTEIYPDQLYRSETDLKLVVNALYNDFNAYMWLSTYEISEMTAGTLYGSWNGDDINYHQWTLNVGIQSRAWSEYERYNYLSKARQVIRGIETASLSDDIKGPYLGEAKALHSWMAVYLYDLFGPVPVAPDEVLDDPETFVYLPRLSEEEYETMVENNLSSAIDLLPEVPAARGRISKGAARMLLMKFYLMKGYFDKAELLARDLYAMEGRVYSLQSDYNYIFSYDGMGNNEVIFQITCNDASRNSCNFVIANALPTDFPWAEKATGWGRGIIMPWDFYDSFEKGDDRLKGVYDHYTNVNGKEITRKDLGKGAIPVKYGLQENMIGDQCTIDMVVYRYSDVLLTLAECIVRNQGTVTQEAIDLVNRVRNRAKLSNLTIEQTASEKAFLEALLWERLHEFYLEGLSRQDQIRFGVYIDWANERIDKANKENNSGFFNVDDSHLRIFIPQGFVDESMNAVKQNPGYE